MDFAYTSEQTQLADALRRWLDNEYNFDTRRQIVKSAEGVSAKAWDGLVEMGLTALPIAEEQGGFGGGALDMLPVMQEIGRGLLIEPYFATVWGARFLQLAGGQQAVLEQVASGEIKLACALQERQARHDLFDITCQARAEGDGFVLNGSKSVVLHGAQADQLIVSARLAGSAQRSEEGISLFLIPAASAGLSRREYRTIDCQRACDVTLENVLVPASHVLGQGGQAWELIQQANDYALCLLCAEAVGAMLALHAATLDYVKTRQQFGAPIGKSQVLQHRLAEMYMQIEQAQSMAMLAAMKYDSVPASEHRRIVAAAKVKIGQAAKYVGQQAVQLHGGIGVTDELQAAHYFKRLTIIDLTLGDVDHHLARFIAQPQFATSAG